MAERAIADGDVEQANKNAKAHEESCDQNKLAQWIIDSEYQKGSIKFNQLLKSFKQALKRPEQCNIFDQFDDDIDTKTPEKLCSLYCPKTSKNPAYCKVKSKEEIEQEETIYDNCFISRSYGSDPAALRSIQRSCEKISNDPSWLQKLRWGN